MLSNAVHVLRTQLTLAQRAVHEAEVDAAWAWQAYYDLRDLGSDDYPPGPTSWEGWQQYNDDCQDAEDQAYKLEACIDVATAVRDQLVTEIQRQMAAPRCLGRMRHCTEIDLYA